MKKITPAAVLFCEQTGGEGPEWKQEIIEVIQVTDDRCLNWGIGSGSDKKESESGYILKVESVSFQMDWM